jgi:hypothetical protein
MDEKTASGRRLPIHPSARDRHLFAQIEKFPKSKLGMTHQYVAISNRDT